MRIPPHFRIHRARLFFRPPHWVSDLLRGGGASSSLNPSNSMICRNFNANACWSWIKSGSESSSPAQFFFKPISFSIEKAFGERQEGAGVPWRSDQFFPQEQAQRFTQLSRRVVVPAVLLLAKPLFQYAGEVIAHAFHTGRTNYRQARILAGFEDGQCRTQIRFEVLVNPFIVMTQAERVRVRRTPAPGDFIGSEGGGGQRNQ